MIMEESGEDRDNKSVKNVKGNRSSEKWEVKIVKSDGRK